MNIIVLSCEGDSLKYSVLKGSSSKPLLEGVAGKTYDKASIKASVAKISESLKAANIKLQLAAMRVLYGGNVFQGPVLANADTIARLATLAAVSPLHIPRVCEVSKRLAEAFPGLPLGLVFETSLFTKLPARESAYAIPKDLAASIGAARYGYHGVYHEAAIEHAAQKLGEEVSDKDSKVISICLEPRTEVCSASGKNPLFSSSGATPLEGLPGETSSGWVDAAIVTCISEKLHWGPERIERFLSAESGLSALAGRKVSIEDVLEGDSDDVKLSRELFLYRVMQAVGSAAAAAGGIDAVVFTGRYVEAVKPLRNMIRRNLEKCCFGVKIKYLALKTPLERLVADMAVKAFLDAGSPVGKASAA